MFLLYVADWNRLYHFLNKHIQLSKNLALRFNWIYVPLNTTRPFGSTISRCTFIFLFLVKILGSEVIHFTFDHPFSCYRTSLIRTAINLFLSLLGKKGFRTFPEFTRFSYRHKHCLLPARPLMLMERKYQLCCE